MGSQGLVGDNPASPPYRNGPYTWDQHVTFSQGISGVNSEGRVFYVDGTNGATGNNGKGWNTAFKTIAAAISAASAGDTIFITAKDITDTTGDPTSYAETLEIPLAKSSLSLIGVSRGRTQGGLPQIKIGTGTTAMLTISAPGCLIANLGFNGASSTGGGILLNDDYSTASAFGTSIVGCHFKNCAKHATDGRLGGAIFTTVDGNAWQVFIQGNRFYKNLADIVVVGTNNTVPQDWVIRDNVFSGPAANTDVNIYIGGSGVAGLIIDNNVFEGGLPAIGSGSVVQFMVLPSGCLGVFSRNILGCTGLTFGDGSTTGGDIATTMFMAANYQEDAIITRTS